MPLPSHLFASSTDGALYDTRAPNWYKLPPLRPNYVKPHSTIATTAQLRATLRADFYPGYGVVFVVDDGESLCPACVRAEQRRISYAIRNKMNNGWRVVGAYCADQCSDGESCAHCNAMLDPFFDDTSDTSDASDAS